MLRTVAMFLCASAVVLAACTDNGIESGDRWTLESVEVVQAEQRPAIETFAVDDGVGVSLAVETSSGGFEDCDLPVISSYGNASNGAVAFRHSWPMRGCADIGFGVFHIVLADVGVDGTIVSFQPGSEGECDRARMFPDGAVEQLAPIDC